MDYDIAVEVIKDRCRQSYRAVGFVEIFSIDFDPPPGWRELKGFCLWLARQGYVERLPLGVQGRWFIHPSDMALSEWGIS